jgi:hypothetical protein
VYHPQALADGMNVVNLCAPTTTFSSTLTVATLFNLLGTALFTCDGQCISREPP